MGKRPPGSSPGGLEKTRDAAALWQCNHSLRALEIAFIFKYFAGPPLSACPLSFYFHSASKCHSYPRN